MQLGKPTGKPGIYSGDHPNVWILRVRAKSSVTRETGRTACETVEKRQRVEGTMAEAIAARERLKEAAEGELARRLRGETRETLTDYAKLWLRDVRDDVTPKSVRTHLDNLERFVLPFFEEIEPHSITSRDVRAWLDWLGTRKTPPTRKTRKGRQVPQEQRPYAQATLHGAWRTLRTFLSWLKVEADLPAHPMDQMRFKLAKKAQVRPPKKKATLTQAEVRQLVQAAAEEPVALRALVLVALVGAMRASEVTGLHWHDVDLASGVLRIERSHVEGNVGEVKTAGSRRDVSLLPELVVLLEEHREEQRREGQDVERGIVFPSSAGTYRRPSSLRDVLERCRVRAGLDKHVTSHVLRRTTNNLHRQTNGDTTARLVTGHVTEDMTRHYSEVDAEERAAATRRAFGDALGSPMVPVTIAGG